MMTSLLRKLVIDVPALTENTITPLRVRHFTYLLTYLFNYLFVASSASC